MRTLIFVVISLALLTGGAYLIYDGVYLRRSAAEYAVLSVYTPYEDAGVFIEGEYAGPTPFFADDLAPGDKDVRVGDWVSKITLTAGTLTVVNQDLGPGVFTGGDVVWLEKTDGETSLVVISDPDGASVSVDNEDVGKTPVRLSDFDVGEHRVVVTKDGYTKRDIRVTTQDGYKLNLSSSMMLNPLPTDVTSIDVSVEALKVYDFSTLNDKLTADVEGWLKGLVFYFSSYGFDSDFKPDYFLTDTGDLYTSAGVLLALEDYPKLGTELTLGYVGPKSDSGLSPAAVDRLNSLVGSGSSVGASPKVRIGQTGTGWLRVRSGPGVGNEEISKINVGEEVPFLDEQEGWYKIKLTDGQEGWIAGQFAEKL